MKNIKKMVSVLLFTIMLLSMFPIFHANAASGVAAKMDDFYEKVKFVDKGDYQYFRGGREIASTCHGFACDLWFHVFGYDVYQNKSYTTKNQNDFTADAIKKFFQSEGRIGDIVRTQGAWIHSYVIRDITDKNVRFYEYGGDKGYSYGAHEITLSYKQLANRWGKGTFYNRTTSYYFLYKINDNIYSEVDGIKVTFDANNGNVSPKEIKVDKNGVVSELPSPTRDGYVFAGWYTNKSGGEQIKSNFEPKQNITLYARWKINISLDANGGAIYTSDGTNKGSKYRYTILSGPMTRDVPTCVRDGYTFKGWYTKKTGGDMVRYCNDLNAHTTLYARWDNNTRDSNRDVFKKGINYVIYSYNSDQALTAAGKEKYARVVQEPYTKSNYQIWTCSYSDDGVYSFTLKADPSLALDARRNGSRRYAAGNPLQVVKESRSTILFLDVNLNPQQMFTAIYRTTINGRRLYSLHSVASGRALDVTGASKADGAAIQTYPYHAVDGKGDYGLGQLFYFYEEKSAPVFSKNSAEPATTATWTSNSVSDITATDAQINGKVAFNKTTRCLEGGFYLGTSADNLVKVSKHDTVDIKIGTGGEKQWFKMSKYGQTLKPDTTYYYCFYLKDSAGNEYKSEVKSFKTKK